MTISKYNAVAKRIDVLERQLKPIDDSNKADMNELLGILAGKKSEPDKPKQAKEAKPVDPELEKLFDSYVEYKKSATHSSDLHEEIILE